MKMFNLSVIIIAIILVSVGILLVGRNNDGVLSMR